MIARVLAFAASIAMAVAPCAAADLNAIDPPGERRSGASAGVYLAIPFGGERSGRTQAGLRLQMRHDYRTAAGHTVRRVGVDTLELRMIGDAQPTLYVAERPVTGRDARHNLFGGGIVNVVVLGLAVVGAVVIYSELSDDEDDDMPHQ